MMPHAFKLWEAELEAMCL